MHQQLSLQGSRGHSFREGGLSKALKSGSSDKASHDSQYAETSGSDKSNLHHTENMVLGRSPSRTFVSANHLLNFQFDRARVSPPVHYLLLHTITFAHLPMPLGKPSQQSTAMNDTAAIQWLLQGLASYALRRARLCQAWQVLKCSCEPTGLPEVLLCMFKTRAAA